MRDARCAMRDARCAMRDARCAMRDARCAMRDARRLVCRVLRSARRRKSLHDPPARRPQARPRRSRPRRRRTTDDFARLLVPIRRHVGRGRRHAGRGPRAASRSVSRGNPTPSAARRS
ncbi:hypothetical protein WT60_13845 [Burkholderia sp. MSMB617WGS]|nr:hypothetical protein WT60_13845 [Burkholderia sp. MSMB617WGS]